MKHFARFLSVVLSIALLLSAAPTALASTSAQREALASYLEQKMPYENVMDAVEGTTFDQIFDIGAFNSDDNTGVIVYAQGSGVDAAIKKIKTGDPEANTAMTLLLLINFAGKIVKNAKAYGITDCDIYFMYVTSTTYAGGEYYFVVDLDMASNKIYFMQDDIFGLDSSSLAFSSIFDPVTYELSLSE